jgi:hypothetical protein
MVELLDVLGNIFLLAAVSLWAHARISRELAPIEEQCKRAEERGVDPDVAFRTAIEVMRTKSCRHRFCFARWLRVRYLEIARKEYARRHSPAS